MGPVSAELLVLNEELTSTKLAPIWKSNTENRKRIGTDFKLTQTPLSQLNDSSSYGLWRKPLWRTSSVPFHLARDTSESESLECASVSQVRERASAKREDPE